MSDVIVYKQDNGVLAVIYPAPEAVDVYGIEAIAQKDVPSGKPYKIIDSADIPTDRTQRTQWTADDTDLTDGVGADFDVFEQKAEVVVAAPGRTPDVNFNEILRAEKLQAERAAADERAAAAAADENAAAAAAAAEGEEA